MNEQAVEGPARAFSTAFLRLLDQHCCA